MQFFLAVLTRYSSTIVQFFLSIIVANVLSLDQAGTYFMLFGLVTSIAVISGFGAPDGAVKLAPAMRESGDATAASGLVRGTLLRGAASAIAIAAVVAIVASLFIGEWLVGALAGVWALGYGLNFIASQCIVASGKGQLGTFTYYGLINWISIAAVGAYVALSDTVTFPGLLACAAGGSLLGACLSFVALQPWKQRGITSRSLTTHALRAGLSISLVRLVQSGLIWAPVWLAGFIFAPSDAAVVAVASRLSMAVGSAIAAVKFSARSRVVELATRGEWHTLERVGRHTAVIATGLGIVASLGVFLFGPQIFTALYGSEYHDLWWVTLLLLVGVIVESMAGLSDEVLKLLGGAPYMLRVQFVIFMVSVAVQIATGFQFGLSPMVLVSSLCFALLYVLVVNRVVVLHAVNPSIIPTPGARRGS